MQKQDSGEEMGKNHEPRKYINLAKNHCQGLKCNRIFMINPGPVSYAVNKIKNILQNYP